MAWPLALLAIGTTLSAYGSISAGTAARDASREAAAQREEAARYARAQAAFEARRQRETDAETLAAYQVAVAKAGLQFQGSAAVVYGESVRRAEENALAIILAGELRARGLEGEARLARMEGRAAYQAGIIQAGATTASAIGRYSLVK